MKTKCSHCGKNFDYENYYGLCPKCGTYNAKKREDSEMDLHRLYDIEKPHEYTVPEETTVEAYTKTGEKKPTGLPRFTICCIIISVLAFICGCVIVEIMQIMEKNRPDTSNVEVVSAIAGQTLSSGDYTYVMEKAYVVATAEEERDIPEGMKLLCVYFSMYYEGKNSDYRDRVMPYVYDGNKYRKNTYNYDFVKLTEDYLFDENELNEYGIYKRNEEEEGYLLYLVDENCDKITVCMEARKNKDLIKIYEVSVKPIEAQERFFEFDEGIEIPYGENPVDPYGYEEEDSSYQEEEKL